ncbi:MULTISPECIES: hypothetical protein [Sphingobacterium]|uniref:hypothetical protein n=1 Tax=Sphingobacterium TaxID=28453 RepID=UPI0028A6C0A5|nr:hypothetical protein [Sphingobacterium multivorum]
MEEYLLMKFELQYLEQLHFMGLVCQYCYRETGNKFSIQINGSKGYLSSIEILCEGAQKPGANVISLDKLITRSGKLVKGKYVHILYSEENGIRCSVGGKNLEKYATEQMLQKIRERKNTLPEKKG